MMLIGILAACGSETTNDGEAADDGDSEDKEIDLYIRGGEKPDGDLYTEELSKLSGYDLNYEFVPLTDYAEKLPVLFASGDLPDVIETDGIQDSLHKGALENGVFTDLGPILEEHGQNILENIPDEVWESPRISKDGEIYGIPVLTAAPNTRVAYVRQDWLDQLDMDLPETTDDWLEFFESVKENDVNEDGDSDDEYGMIMQKAYTYNELFFGSFGVHPEAWHMQDGEMIPDMITPEMKDAIEFYKELYSNEYVNTDDMFTIEAEDVANEVGQDRAGSYVNSVMAYKTRGNPDFYDQDSAEIALVAPPEGPNGESGLELENDQISSVWVIPEDSEKAEQVIKFLDWAWSAEEAEKFFAFGIEGHNYTEEDGEIIYDEDSPENADNYMFAHYRVTMNPRGDATLYDISLEATDYEEEMQEGLEIAEENAIQDDALGMPVLDAYSAAPEIDPGMGDGTLFAEMFAKVITGEKELDEGFDEFVEEWKSRGGEEAIEEATEWYNENN